MQIEAWRRLGLEGRVAVMLDMCEMAASTSKWGIRHRHPDYTDEQVHDAFLVLLWGEELFSKACPGRPLCKP
ncbi:MAG: hypothetical protein AB2A00_28045 [Myxococcota bacterium]